MQRGRSAQALGKPRVSLAQDPDGQQCPFGPAGSQSQRSHSACASFRAGQYRLVLMRDGGRRNFSTNPPQDNDGTELHIRYVAGGRSPKTWPGDELGVERPFG